MYRRNNTLSVYIEFRNSVLKNRNNFKSHGSYHTQVNKFVQTKGVQIERWDESFKEFYSANSILIPKNRKQHLKWKSDRKVAEGLKRLNIGKPPRVDNKSK